MAKAVTRHHDSQIKKWGKALAERLQLNRPQKEIEEARRHVRAWMNLKASHLKRRGFDNLLKRHQDRLRAAEEAVDAARDAMAAPEIDAENAAKMVEELALDVAAAQEKLNELLMNAPEQLAASAPPWLARVEVKRGAGESVYLAEWSSAQDRVDKKIEILRKSIEGQKDAIQACKPRIEEWSQAAMAAQQECDRLMQEYQSQVWWAAWKTIFVELGDSAVTICRDWKTFGPYAFAVEGADRLINWGKTTRNMDVTDLPWHGGKGTKPSGYAPFWDASKSAVIKSSLKKLLEAQASADFGGLVNGHEFKGFRHVEGGRMWMLVEKEVLWDGSTVEWVTEADPMKKWLKNSPRALAGAIGRHLKDPTMWKELGTDIFIAAGKELLLQEVDATRLSAWSRYMAADTIRWSLTNSLTAEGRRHYFHIQLLKAMQEEMTDLLEERDRAANFRELKRVKDEVLVGKEEFALSLTFSGPVEVESVKVGDKTVEGTLDGKVWTGSFSIVDLPETAAIHVAAIDPVTEKELDDPRTVAVFTGTQADWSGYEPGFDGKHRVKLKPVRPGVSIVLLVDCSDSMEKNDRMAKAKKAAHEVLDPARLSPDDEVALYAFFGCSDIRQLVPFTQNPEAVRGAIEALKPVGHTPLAEAILAAGTYLHRASQRENRVLIVLTDGQESCEGNPYQAAEEIRKLGQEVQLR